MPVLNVADLLGAKKVSQDYGFLVDQLEIKENQLSSDGKLSPGDYKLLKKQAMEAYPHPGLSPSQRSNLLVKMSSYDKSANTSTLNTASDIGRMNNEAKDNHYKATMLLANDPQAFLQAKSQSLRDKLNQLSDVINIKQSSGDDPSAHVNEYEATLSELNDTQQALDDVTNYDKSGTSKSNYAAFVTTNSRGEINDIQIDRSGNKNGYVETNGLYGGLRIYGKAHKEMGGNVFRLGSQTFKGSDSTVFDPATGTFTSAPLISDKSSKGARNPLINPKDLGVDIDPNEIRPQAAIYDNGWAQGASGFLYQKLPGGKYVKYTDADKAKIQNNLSDGDIFKIPSNLESTLIPSVVETRDSMQSFTPPAPTSPGPVTQTAPAAPSTTPTTLGEGRSRTGAPTVRAPQTAGSLGQNLVQKAKGFFAGLFSQ